MRSFSCIYLVFYVFSGFLFTYAYGTCQCNQMLHPGVFSGERMTFATEENHNRDKRSESGRKQPFTMGAISFEPPYLDFGEQPVGMPYVRDVTVFNPSNEKDLQLQTLSGDNVHFHASLPKLKALSPLTNTSVEVIFLARSLGNVENTLFIHTSMGAYPYQVRGFGIQNPYRLHPFLDIKIALDHSFSSVINMYNPHDSMLQVTEIYSSGGDLHLELPTGEEDASHKQWQIASYETKAIIKLSFLGRVASNHTSFIRIHTNKFIGLKQFLILPVEVEVSAVPGLFSAIPHLDFGTLRRMDEPKSIVVSLMNTANKPVSLTEIIVDPPNKAVTVDIKIPLIKHSHQYVKAFVVTYSASNVKNPKQHLGKIIIRSTSKNTPRLEINYQVNVLQGTLAYSVSKTRFFIGSSPFQPILRDIIITNTFTFPLVIHRVLVSADIQDSFSIVNFSSPIIVQEQKTVTPFSVRFLANKSMSTFPSSIRVYTNASIFTIPINCYDGKLKFPLADSVLDFGTLAVTQKHYKIFEVSNPNPVEVFIERITSDSSLAKIIYINNENNSDNVAVNETTEGLSIKPGRVSKFRLEIVVPQMEGEYDGNISFNTTYETKVLSFSFKAARGRIEIDPMKIVFPPSFPGQVQKLPLFLKSTFINPVNVMSAMVKIDGKHFSFLPIKKSNAQLAPHNRQKIGDVLFDPSLLCSPRCYLGTEDKAWFESISLPPTTANIDTTYLDIFQTKWNAITKTGRNNFSSNLVIDTETVKGVNATIEGGLVWPSLTSDKPVRFPLTHVGNISRRTLMLFNSANVPVVIQIVPLSVYPDAQSVLDVLSERFDVDLLTAKPSYHSCFSLPTARKSEYKSDASLFDGTRASMESQLDAKTFPNTMSVVIAPRSKVKIPVQFKPENEDQRTSVMFIRNNLTVLDIVTVQGQGARGELMINGKRPSVDSVLLFELKQRHLTDCTKLNHGSGGNSYRELTVKKTVIATNPGQLATQVTSFSIDGYECEGYGFKVLNCKALSLKPTATVKIDITFTPDFSVSRVSRRLQIKTALGAVFEFSLIATIPSELIPLCAAAAGRPVWEFHIYISAIAVMMCLLVGVMVMAHFEANKLIAVNLSSLNPGTRLLNGSPMNGELFDLRKITAPRQTSSDTIRANLEKNGAVNVRRPHKKEITLNEKTTTLNNSSLICRQNSNEVYESLQVSNNNSIDNETPENENNRVRINEATGKKNKKTTSSSQTNKRKDSDSDAPKPVLIRSVITPEMVTDKEFHSVTPDTVTTSSINLRDSSSSETNSICSDVSAKKSKIRKKTAKVSPAVVPGNKVKTEKPGKVVNVDKDKEKTKDKLTSSGKLKEKRTKNDMEIKDEKKEVRKQETANKTSKYQSDKVTKLRRVSLPVEFENTNIKTKDNKPSVNTSEKCQGKVANSSRKAPVVRNNSLPVSRSRKHIGDGEELTNGDGTPHTISEAINSALEATLKISPNPDSTNKNHLSRSHSRCSSVSPSPPLSDSSLELSRSSSYSSVVGSEESVSSENLNQRKKHNSKAKKPTPLTIPKNKETSGAQSEEIVICNGVNPWAGIWDSSLPKTKERPGVEPFSSVSTSLFASTPFDKDVKLENPQNVIGSSYPEEHNKERSPAALYTFSDVKAPGMSTPFVDTDTLVPKFWPDDPISTLESLVPKTQKRSTNWVNFLDESSSGTPNLPSPGMPQSTKTVAEIWDSGQHDENDGWSAAFSPTFDSELSPTSFPSFHQPYETSWSSGSNHQNDYFGMPSESTWGGANSGAEQEYYYHAHQGNHCPKGPHQLNPLSKPWNANNGSTSRWSSAASYND